MRANDVYMCIRIRFNEMKKREKVSVVPSPSLTKQQTTMRERENNKIEQIINYYN